MCPREIWRKKRKSMNGFGDRELIWWAGASEKLERFLLLNTGVSSWRRPWRSLLAYFLLASRAETRGRNLKGRNLNLQDTWLGTMMCFYKVVKWAGVSWILDLLRFLCVYLTLCYQNWSRTAHSSNVRTSADWAYLYRHCKNFEDALKLIKSVIVKSYLKINSHLQYFFF